MLAILFFNPSLADCWVAPLHAERKLAHAAIIVTVDKDGTTPPFSQAIIPLVQAAATVAAGSAPGKRRPARRLECQADVGKSRRARFTVAASGRFEVALIRDSRQGRGANNLNTTAIGLGVFHGLVNFIQTPLHRRRTVQSSRHKNARRLKCHS
jgi:hypothetical protein